MSIFNYSSHFRHRLFGAGRYFRRPTFPEFVEQPIPEPPSPSSVRVSSVAATCFAAQSAQPLSPEPSRTIGAVSDSPKRPIPDQAAFDRFTPAKRFAATTDGDRITIQPSPGTRQTMTTGQRFLYSFKMDSYTADDGTPVPEKRYIGYTENGIGRLALHIFGFNHSESSGSRFYKDVKDHPERLSWGIIRVLGPDEDAAAAESEAIQAKDSIGQGYNIRLGGGGGARHSSSELTCPFSIPEIVGMIKSSYSSPNPKKLQQAIRVRKGTSKKVFTVPLSETEKRARNVVYDFFFEYSDNKEDRVHHIGQTSRPFGTRISEHFSGVNNPDTKAGKAIPVYKMIRANPDLFRMRMFNVDELIDKGIPLPLLEKAFMQYFISRGEEVENERAGGKGPVPH